MLGHQNRRNWDKYSIILYHIKSFISLFFYVFTVLVIYSGFIIILNRLNHMNRWHCCCIFKTTTKYRL